LEYIAKLGEQNNWNVIYKPHPLTLTQLKDNDHFQMPKNVIYIESGDMYDVFKVSDVVITIVSAVSYSALIKNIPVVQLGYQCLHGQDCAYDALSFEAIEPVIKQALKDGRTDEQKANFERHCAQLLKYYLFDDMQPNHTRYGLQPEKVVELMDIVIDGKTTEDFIFRT
jgi:CDP-glycerol glycerophosphotransferase (TagB/SpsB family)